MGGTLHQSAMGLILPALLLTGCHQSRRDPVTSPAPSSASRPTEPQASDRKAAELAVRQLWGNASTDFVKRDAQLSPTTAAVTQPATAEMLRSIPADSFEAKLDELKRILVAHDQPLDVFPQPKLKANEIDQIALALVSADDVQRRMVAGKIEKRVAEAEQLSWLLHAMSVPCSLPDQALERVARQMAGLSADARRDPYFNVVLQKMVAQFRLTDPAKLPKTIKSFGTIGPDADQQLIDGIVELKADHNDRLLTVITQLRGDPNQAIERALSKGGDPKLTIERVLSRASSGELKARETDLKFVRTIITADPTLLNDKSLSALRELAVPVSQFEELHTLAFDILIRSKRLESGEGDRLRLMYKARYGSDAECQEALAKLGKSASDADMAKVLVAVLRGPRSVEVVLTCAEALAATPEQVGPAADVLVGAMVNVARKDASADRMQRRQAESVMRRLATVIAACGDEGARAVDKAWRSSKANPTSQVLPHVASVGSAAAPMLSAMYDASTSPTDQLAVATELGRATVYCPVAERKLLEIASKAGASTNERIIAVTSFRWSDGRDPAIHQVLQAALTSDNADLRSAGAETIIRLPPPDAKLAVEAVLPWLAADAAQPRIKAAMLLRELPGKVPVEKVLPELLKMTTNQRPQTRVAAAYAIAAIEPKGVTASLAARNLASHGDVIALRLLMPGLQARKDNALRGDMRVMSLQDANPEAREAARMVVQTLGLPE